MPFLRKSVDSWMNEADPSLLQRFTLMKHDLIAPFHRQVEESIHRFPLKPLPVFGRRLDFYKFAGRGVGDVHVDLRLGVQGIVQVEVTLSINDADADGGDLVRQGLGWFIVSRIV